MGSDHSGFCSFVDHSGKSGIGPQSFDDGWTERPIRYDITKYSTQLSKDYIERSVDWAFRLWATAGSFTHARSPNSPHIRVAFLKRDDCPWGFSGGGDPIVGHGYPPPPISQGIQYAGQVHLNDAVRLSTTDVVPADHFDFLTVLAHEIGHALGVKHNNDKRALMWPGYPLDTQGHRVTRRYLTANDAAAIRGIYGEAVTQ